MNDESLLNLADQSTLLEMILNISDINDSIMIEKEFPGDEKARVKMLKSQITYLTQKLTTLKHKSFGVTSLANKIKCSIEQLECQDRVPRNEADTFLRLETEIPRLEHEYTMKELRLKELEAEIARVKAKNLELRQQNCQRVHTSTLKPPPAPNAPDPLSMLIAGQTVLK